MLRSRPRVAWPWRGLHPLPQFEAADLPAVDLVGAVGEAQRARVGPHGGQREGLADPATPDRKSTRLNSSHVRISYAVFCLKKKKQPIIPIHIKNKKKKKRQ